MNLLKKIRYPKFILLLLTFLIAYLIFNGREISIFKEFLLSFGYLGTFIAGIFFAYGFTATPATAVLLIVAKEQNIILAGLIAGLGALVGDLLIFKFIKLSFAEEVGYLSKSKIVKGINHIIPNTIKKAIILVLAGFIIASPLPDEIGVVVLASATTISTRTFSIISYILNTAGIFVILIIGNAI